MKRNLQTRHAIAPLLLAWMLLPGVSRGMTNAFTYQGRLTDAGAPASGSYDLRFRLFDAATGGNQLSDTLTNPAVAVNGGLFTVALNFGPAVFDGSDRWLEIAGRTNSLGDFGTLTPRQLLTPAPYALFAGQAANLTGVLP